MNADGTIDMQTAYGPWQNPVEYLLAKAEHLRRCQRAYMADPGNQDKGAEIGLAAQKLDDAIALAGEYVASVGEGVELETENERLRRVITSLIPSRFPGPFICGAGGRADDGLHDRYHICVSYGSDHVAIYERVRAPSESNE